MRPTATLQALVGKLLLRRPLARSSPDLGANPQVALLPPPRAFRPFAVANGIRAASLRGCPSNARLPSTSEHLAADRLPRLLQLLQQPPVDVALAGSRPRPDSPADRPPSARPVDPAEPLLQPVWLPVPLVVDHQMRPLEVDALARGVGRQEHPYPCGWCRNASSAAGRSSRPMLPWMTTTDVSRPRRVEPAVDLPTPPCATLSPCPTAKEAGTPARHPRAYAVQSVRRKRLPRIPRAGRPLATLPSSIGGVPVRHERRAEGQIKPFYPRSARPSCSNSTAFRRFASSINLSNEIIST